MKDRTLAVVDGTGLMLKEAAVLRIWFGVYIEWDQRANRNGDHVIEAEEAEIAAVQLIQVRARFEVRVVWLRRFHWDKVTVLADKQNDANIGTAAVLIELHAAVTGPQEPYVMVLDAVNTQFYHNPTFPAKKKARREAQSRFLIARVFEPLLNGKGFPLFPGPT